MQHANEPTSDLDSLDYRYEGPIRFKDMGLLGPTKQALTGETPRVIKGVAPDSLNADSKWRRQLTMQEGIY